MPPDRAATLCATHVPRAQAQSSRGSITPVLTRRTGVDFRSSTRSPPAMPATSRAQGYRYFKHDDGESDPVMQIRDHMFTDPGYCLFKIVP